MLTTEDRLAILDLFDSYGHVIDSGEWAGARSIFSDDADYDVSDLGRGSLRGAAAIAAHWERTHAGWGIVAHHGTNVHIIPRSADEADVASKGLIVKTDGKVMTFDYQDVVARRPEGWRIVKRVMIFRGPRERK